MVPATVPEVLRLEEFADLLQSADVILVRMRNYDDVELGEVDVRRDEERAGQAAAGGVDAGDDTDRDTGHERLVGLRAEGDQPVALLHLGLAVEEFDAQRTVALAGGEAELVGGLHAGADGEVGVVGEEHGGGVRADRGDAAAAHLVSEQSDGSQLDDIASFYPAPKLLAEIVRKADLGMIGCNLQYIDLGERAKVPGGQSAAMHFEGRALHDWKTSAFLDGFLDLWLARDARAGMGRAAE